MFCQALRSQWNVQMHIFWPRDLNLWPMTLTHELQLDIVPLDQLPKSKSVCLSVRLGSRDGRMDTHTHDVKTITPIRSETWGVNISDTLDYKHHCNEVVNHFQIKNGSVLGWTTISLVVLWQFNINWDTKIFTFAIVWILELCGLIRLCSILKSSGYCFPAGSFCVNPFIVGCVIRNAFCRDSSKLRPIAITYRKESLG